MQWPLLYLLFWKPFWIWKLKSPGKSGSFRLPCGIKLEAQPSARARRVTLGVCVLVGKLMEGGITVLSMGEGMCLSVTLLRIKKTPEYTCPAHDNNSSVWALFRAGVKLTHVSPDKVYALLLKKKKTLCQSYLRASPKWPLKSEYR